MPLSPFHAYYKARSLSSLTGRDKLVSAFASSDIEVYPYQIAAATFALRSPYLKGAILCDDGSLGKSFEAMLIITQRWYEGKRRILIAVPTPLLRQ
jgi:SNF2 family DNA or RNA helicase